MSSGNKEIWKKIEDYDYSMWNHIKFRNIF